MNINLGDILAAAEKRMEISNEADRILNERHSRNPEEEARENNRHVISELGKMGMNVKGIRF